MDARVRSALRVVSRHLTTLVACYRTRDRTVLTNVASFVEGRHLHTFALDSRDVIYQIDALATDAVPMTPRTRELFAALRSYLSYLEGVLVVEPPAFRLAPRVLDVRCIAFLPEVAAFRMRIEALISAG